MTTSSGAASSLTRSCISKVWDSPLTTLAWTPADSREVPMRDTRHAFGRPNREGGLVSSATRGRPVGEMPCTNARASGSLTSSSGGGAGTSPTPGRSTPYNASNGRSSSSKPRRADAPGTRSRWSPSRSTITRSTSTARRRPNGSRRTSTTPSQQPSTRTSRGGSTTRARATTSRSRPSTCWSRSTTSPGWSRPGSFVTGVGDFVANNPGAGTDG